MRHRLAGGGIDLQSDIDILIFAAGLGIVDFNTITHCPFTIVDTLILQAEIAIADFVQGKGFARWNVKGTYSGKFTGVQFV